MKFGVQLYNFRNELSGDFRTSLQKIADMGFDGVEFVGNYGNMSPDELAAFLKEIHLECAGTMFGSDPLQDEKNIAYEYAEKLNSPAVTIGAHGDFTKIWREIAEISSRIGKIAARHGTVFSYHNHWSEFVDVDGIPAIDRILAATDPADVFVEPDVCWVTRGGGVPADFIRKYGKRIRQIHMKDSKMPEDPEQLTELGHGVIDLKAVFQAAKEIGAQWLIYEQDISPDPFRSAEISLKYLKTL